MCSGIRLWFLLSDVFWLQDVDRSSTSCTYDETFWAQNDWSMSVCGTSMYMAERERKRCWHELALPLHEFSEQTLHNPKLPSFLVLLSKTITTSFLSFTKLRYIIAAWPEERALPGPRPWIDS